MAALLAVDLGLHTGLALYGEDGRLAWYRSRHFGNRASLKRGAYTLLSGAPQISHIVLEGGTLGEVWTREAKRRAITVRQVSAEIWRARLLLPREQRNGRLAKAHAQRLARQVVIWSDLGRPLALGHDTSEAILLGLWAVLELGWLPALPPELDR